MKENDGWTKMKQQITEHHKRERENESEHEHLI